MYADDIVLLAPSALQELLHICEAELVCVDMSLNAGKSMGIRNCPRHKHNCCELTTMDGHKIQWSNEIRYVCVYLISSEIYSISSDNAKKSFYRAFNALFSKVRRVASENVVVELLETKCFPILLYGMKRVRLQKNTVKFAKLCHL